MEKILHMANQNVQDALKKFQDIKTNNRRRHTKNKGTQRGLQQTPK
jgi:hypothetical protein